MRKGVWLVPPISLILVGGWPASATDYWDASVINDNSAIATYNELYHGLSQQHDLEANPGPTADEDWYFFFNRPFSSYEAVIDSASADIATTDLALVAAD